MNIQTPEKTALVRAECAENPTMPSLTLARFIYGKHPHLWPNLDACCQSVRRVRGNKGKFHRKYGDPSLHRPNQPAGCTWAMPKSVAEDWKPFELSTEKNLVLADIHIPFHEPAVLEVALKYGRKYKPDCIILDGDIADFYSISKFDHNPSAPQLKEEMKAVKDFLGYLRQMFPKSRIIYKMGNHDERWSLYVWRKGKELFDVVDASLSTLLTEENKVGPAVGGIEFVDEQRIIQYDKLSIIHGHEFGHNMFSPVNPARGNFLRGIECSLAGHLHRSSKHVETSMLGRVISCWSVGCLCGMHPEYARLNKWNHGFAVVELDHRGKFKVDNYTILDGEIV